MKRQIVSTLERHPPHSVYYIAIYPNNILIVKPLLQILLL
jgi:hypothetical protein